MRKVNAEAWEQEAIQVTVLIEKPIEEYALAYLAICNNVRDNKDLIKAENYAWNNKVAVTARPEVEKEVTEWLSQWGEITRIEKVLAYEIYVSDDIDWDTYYEQVLIPEFGN